MRRTISRLERHPQQPPASLARQGRPHLRAFHRPSNDSNGNTFDFEGRQIACERERRLVRYEQTGRSRCWPTSARWQAVERAQRRRRSSRRRDLVHRSRLWRHRPLRGQLRHRLSAAHQRKPSTGSMRKTGKKSARSPTSISNRTASASSPITRSSISPTPGSRITRTPRTSSGNTMSTATSSPTAATLSSRWNWTARDGFSGRHAGRHRRQHLGRRRLGRRRL